MGGTGAFDGGAPGSRALAAIYLNYAHLVVRADAGIRILAGRDAARRLSYNVV